MSAVLTVYAVGIVWFTAGLWMYHNYLVSTNQTTYEQIKGVYSNGQNPFNRGTLGNYRDVLLSQVRPRFFDAHTGKLLWPPKRVTATDLKEARASTFGKDSAVPLERRLDEAAGAVREVSDGQLPKLAVTSRNPTSVVKSAEQEAPPALRPQSQLETLPALDLGTLPQDLGPGSAEPQSVSCPVSLKNTPQPLTGPASPTSPMNPMNSPKSDVLPSPSAIVSGRAL
ncbi:unnamed protein product [Polarella glacialis]|uniref:Protein S-acyltransferase n=1 Tax=Polarella glacialis TaxID=89957 RepID=A0A813KAE5_POLGL|nr:unnamed protein product [Polarella glacialis]